MTRRDYELIAYCIREARYDEQATFDTLVTALMAMLKEQNRRFNMDRFRNATYDEAREADRVADEQHRADMGVSTIGAPSAREDDLDKDAKWLRSV